MKDFFVYLGPYLCSLTGYTLSSAILKKYYEDYQHKRGIWAFNCKRQETACCQHFKKLSVTSDAFEKHYSLKTI